MNFCAVPAFTIYDDIREKLVACGIPREQIAFIHEANTEARKKELFAKVRAGQVRVLMGSTFKMGAGMNVQDRLIALHDLDCPWRPGDLEQRGGRIVRQGNRNKEVHIYRYVTEGTFDAYLWQTIENKQRFISQIMTSKSPVRSCEDIDETALSYAEIKALCAGDERIKENMDLDVDVVRLKLMPNNLKELRLKTKTPAKEMVAVVQTIYPKYDMTSQSKCENSDAYGVCLTQKAMKLLYAKFDPDGSVRKNFRTADQHKLKDKLHARITADEAAQLKAHLAADGYDTVQDWLTDIVRGYISKGDRE